MMEGDRSDLARLLDEYKKLKRPDQQAIMAKLPEEICDRLTDHLDEERSVLDGKEEDTPASQSEFAPWLAACLDKGRRKDFPSLRNDFEMTEHASESLSQILGLHEANAETEQLISVVPANDIDLPRHQGPSLMNKMGNFLSKKIMSL